MKEQSYRAGEGVGGGCPPSTVGIFLKMCVSKQAFFWPLLGVGFVVE